MVAAIVFGAFEWYVSSDFCKDEPQMEWEWESLRANIESFEEFGSFLKTSVLTSLPRLLFLATTVLGALHVMRSRNSTSTKPAANMEVNAGV